MDLGSAFAVSVLRQPHQEAIVDGDRRLSYTQWYREIRTVAAGEVQRHWTTSRRVRASACAFSTTRLTKVRARERRNSALAA